ncbi:DUF2807 domain-containing protein [Hyphococcus flavus]|uniref:DUF2807 domain-containing protein n=1 Tax=Hyphococcus flavus TaxID=1866326 RepID=A0AAF0CG63_9PROT|nr:head GIN domain-containing protein [Hyphococcus flavus]WDI30357.1 DUF2807 domain-containing protein [Hyphococcus flavus]
MTIKCVLTAGAVSCLAFSAAQAETRNFDFSGFSAVEASAGLSVEVTVGGDYSVRAEGDADDLEKLRLELDGDTLEVGRKRSSIFQRNSRSDITVFVSMPSMNEASASSGSELTATGIDAGDFSASVSSGAEATLSGTCDTIDASGSTGADLDADDLRCSHADADVSTGASLSLYASESIEADASTGGDIVVYGGPANTDIDKSTGGSVRVRD